MRQTLLDLALAVLAFALLAPVGLLGGWFLPRSAPGEVVEVDLEPLSHHAGSADSDLGVGRVGSRTIGGERLQWYALRLPGGGEAALLSPVSFSFYELARFEGPRLLYEDGPSSLVVEVRP